MAARLTSRNDGIVLDACCVMTLYASGEMAGILGAIQESVKVAAYVKDSEALSIYAVSKHRALPRRELIDLQPLIDSGLIEIVDLASVDEWAIVIDLTSRRLDDGEAISAAIAVTRNWALATDDRAARRVSQQRYPAVELLTTSQLVRHWVDHAGPQRTALANALSSIENRANFVIGQNDPQFDWWQSSKASDWKDNDN